MKAKIFVEKLIDIAKNHKTLYVMGCFGSPLNGDNVNRYTTNHPYNAEPVRTKMIKNVSNKMPPYYGFDCVCLLKGVLWGWNGNPNNAYGGALYLSNGVPDINADSMMSRCLNVSTVGWDNLKVGEALWTPGHIGVYIGNGLVVESTPRWENKVQITAVENIGKKSGYNSKMWNKHGLLSYVDYSDNIEHSLHIPPKKRIEEIAQEVIAGLWGNGIERKTKLTDAGYDYVVVQNKVNSMMNTKVKTIDQIVQEVIIGSWGNGNDRKNKLTKAGYDYDEIQKRVNSEIAIEKVAREVIQGVWGNGLERKKRLTEAGYDYDVIQKKVNDLV